MYKKLIPAVALALAGLPALAAQPTYEVAFKDEQPFRVTLNEAGQASATAGPLVQGFPAKHIRMQTIGTANRELLLRVDVRTPFEQRLTSGENHVSFPGVRSLSYEGITEVTASKPFTLPDRDYPDSANALVKITRVD